MSLHHEPDLLWPDTHTVPQVIAKVKEKCTK